MNKKCMKAKKSSKNSPVLFEEEEVGTLSSDEVKIKLSATPKSITYSGHSTPIQNKIKTDSSDSPELTYNESPIEPLTQHPPNEVGWDYQRPVIKEEGGTAPISMDISKTPKRNVLLSKKRNSNSPLLYKPLKKKLIQEEQQENMAGFMEELKAMEIKAIEIKAKKVGEKNEIPQKTESEVESQLIVEMDSQPSDDSDIKLQVSANTDESPGQGKIATINKNYDALLDDSIEDIMVMCSQEVEAKEFGVKKTPHIIPPPANTSREKNSSRHSPNSSLEKMFNNLSKENVQPLNNNEKVANDSSGKNSSTSKGDSGSLEIPDDSFDDFFVGIDDKDFCKNVNTEIFIDSVNKSVKSCNKTSMKSISSTVPVTTSKSSSIQNKFFQSRSSTYTAQSKVVPSSTNNYNYSQASNASVQSKVVNTKASFGYLNKDYMKNSSSSGFSSQTQSSHSSIIDRNSETRLFKAKSFSDSNFLQQSNSINKFGSTHRSNSNLSINSTNQHRLQNKNFVNQNSESSRYAFGSSTANKGVRRINSSSSIGRTSVSNDISQKSSVNSVSNSERSQSQSTPAEIERKRQEAIMKREAKLKNNFNNPTLSRPIQHPVKR